MATESFDAAVLNERDDPEAAVVLGWRFGQLLGAGYGPEEAFTLARRSDVDLHLAVELIARGCSVPTAVRILA